MRFHRHNFYSLLFIHAKLDDLWHWSHLGFIALNIQCCRFHANIVLVFHLFYLQVRASFCRTLEDMCHDWTGRTIEYKILFECLMTDCHKKYPLDLCQEMKVCHPCDLHDFNLNTVRKMFGKCLNSYLDFDIILYGAINKYVSNLTTA